MCMPFNFMSALTFTNASALWEQLMASPPGSYSRRIAYVLLVAISHSTSSILPKPLADYAYFLPIIRMLWIMGAGCPNAMVGALPVLIMYYFPVPGMYALLGLLAISVAAVLGFLVFVVVSVLATVNPNLLRTVSIFVIVFPLAEHPGVLGAALMAWPDVLTSMGFRKEPLSPEKQGTIRFEIMLLLLVLSIGLYYYPSGSPLVRVISELMIIAISQP